MPVGKTSSPALVRGDGIAKLVAQIDELTGQNQVLRDEVERHNTTFTVTEVAEQLDATGFWDTDQFTVQVVHDFAWFHPDWFSGGLLTVVGAQNVRYDRTYGLVFTVDGRDAVLDQLGCDA